MRVDRIGQPRGEPWVGSPPSRGIHCDVVVVGVGLRAAHPRQRWPFDLPPPRLRKRGRITSKRLLRKEVAESVRARTQGQRGTVVKAVQERKAEPPPLPYSLADIQMDGTKRLAAAPKPCSRLCQSLYETISRRLPKILALERLDLRRAMLDYRHFVQAPRDTATASSTSSSSERERFCMRLSGAASAPRRPPIQPDPMLTTATKVEP